MPPASPDLTIDVDRARPAVDTRLLAVALVPAAGIAGALAVGSSAFTTERVWAGLFAAAMAALGLRCRAWAWVVMAGLAAVVTDGPLRAVAVVLLVASLAGAVRAPRLAVVGAAIVGVATVLVLAGRALEPPTTAALAVVPVLLVVASAIHQSPRRQRAAIALALVLLVAVTVLASAGYAFAAWSASNDALDGIDHLEAGLDAAEAQDPTQATVELESAAVRLEAAADALAKPWAKPMTYLPMLGRNARAVERVAEHGRDIARVAADAATSIDLDDITITDGRVDLGLAERVRVASTDVADALDRARADIVAMRSPWLVAPLTDRLDDALDTIDEAIPTVHNVRDASTVAPILLGGDQPRHYLALFTTPSEARGRSGFPGNFAELEAVGGRIRMTRFGRIDELTNSGVPLAQRIIDAPEDYAARYARYQPAQTWVNLGLTPDVPTMASLAAQLYPQSGGRQVDGVLVVDPWAMQAFLELTGPVQVPGLATPIDARNALQFLLVEQYANITKDARVDLLEEVARATFDKLTNTRLPSVKRASELLSPVTREGHLRLVSFDERVAPVLARARIDGAMPRIAGDNVAVIANNAGGNKMDAFLTRSTSYDVTWDATSGTFDAELRVTLMSDAPARGLPTYIVGSPLRALEPSGASPPAGTNRVWLSVYSPWTPTLASSSTYATPLQVEQELGRWVGSTTVDVVPGATVTLTYRWTGRLDPPGVYLLDVVHQPLARTEQLTVTVRERNGRALTNADGIAQSAVVTQQRALTSDERVLVQASNR